MIREAPLITAGNLVQATAATNPHFAGVSLGGNQTYLNLYLTAADPALVALASTGLNAGQVHVTYVSTSYQKLADVQAEIETDFDKIAAEGDPVLEISVNPDTDSVEVDLQNLNSVTETLMTVRYGPYLTFELGNYTVPASGRYSDSPPYSGGDILGDDRGEGNCTSGVPLVAQDNSIYMVTDGHCFSEGATVTNNYIALGTVGQRYPKVGGQTIDAETFRVSSGIGRIWTQDPGYFGHIHYQGDVVKGSVVCKAGITTNQTCGITIDKIGSAAKTVGYGYFYHQAVGHGPGGPEPTEKGDSGGPVFIVNDPAGFVTTLGTTEGFQVDDGGNRVAQSYVMNELGSIITDTGMKGVLYGA